MVIVNGELNNISRYPAVGAIKVFSQTVVANADAAFTAIDVLAIVEKDESVVKLAKSGGTYITRLHLIFRRLQPLTQDLDITYSCLLFCTGKEAKNGQE